MRIMETLQKEGIKGYIDNALYSASKKDFQKQLKETKKYIRTKKATWAKDKF